MGVKSWECNNILCPEKSKFNRGKRYSLSSLIKQEAIFYEENEIKNGTIKKWQLDLLTKPNTDDILDFLIKHYSLVRDTIEVTNYQTREKLYGRNVKSNDFSVVKDGTLERFYNSAYFRRFVLKNNVGDRLRLNNISPYVHHEIYNGDSNVIIRSLDKNSVDGAVTSPPYYNAKEYSQWDNIYCYLYDMYNNALAVYDVLKPGASYLYNIFDYFDN